VLERACNRQNAIQQKLRECKGYLDLDGVTQHALRASGDALRSRGLMASIRSDVREAKRTFLARWHGGPRPHRRSWPSLLYGAADALVEAELFSSDRELRKAIGGDTDPLHLPLHEIASIAVWQQEVLETLSADRPETCQFQARIVACEHKVLAGLATVAGRARKLVSFLDDRGFADRRRWSSICEETELRAEALALLLRLVTELGLRPGVTIGQLAELHSAHQHWHGSSRLAAPPLRELLTEISASPAHLRTTAEFARAVWAAFPTMASGLLADGWIESIGKLQYTTGCARQAADALRVVLDAARPLRLNSFLLEVEHQSFENLQYSIRQMGSSDAELATYLRFAAVRADCVRDELAKLVVEAYEADRLTLRHLLEALEWLVAWTVVRRCAERDREAFVRTGAQLSTLRQSFAVADRQRKQKDALAAAAAALRRPVPAGSNIGGRHEWTGFALLRNEFGK
jgi:hypothetical protein